MPSDAFLKVDGVAGESTDDAHKDEFELFSYSFGCSMPINENRSTAGNRSAGRVNFTDLTVTKTVDKGSPLLMEKVCKGDHIASVILTLNRAGGEKIPYLTVTLTGVMVSNITWGGSGEGLATETISLTFDKIEYKYKPTDSAKGSGKGDVTKTHDLVANKSA